MEMAAKVKCRTSFVTFCKTKIRKIIGGPGPPAPPPPPPIDTPLCVKVASLESMLTYLNFYSKGPHTHDNTHDEYNSIFQSLFSCSYTSLNEQEK